MEGKLQFVPGSRRRPAGADFDVSVAPFSLPTFQDDVHYISTRLMLLQNDSSQYKSKT